MSRFDDYLENKDKKPEKKEPDEVKQIERVENDQHRKAFGYFINLGADRSYARVAEMTGYSANTIRCWASWFKWSERVRELEAQSSEIANMEALKDLTEVKSQSLAILQALRDKFQEEVTGGLVKITNLNEFATLVKLDNLLRGMPTDINENRNLNANANVPLPDCAKKFLGWDGETPKAPPCDKDDNVVDAEFTQDIAGRFGLTNDRP